MDKLFTLAVIVAALYFVFIREEDKYDPGYSDGYAEGYNSTCQIRATLVEGDWDNSTYTTGYNDGRRAGAEACIDEKKLELIRNPR